ncbi:TIGR00341 family protein [Phototrophicus methaneseepsis]|uniref:TIGR00341 family protein n=1 Tax=Phototrophicus methaneseepsis TaxID=2710758 RepID=A0A7S8E6K0_9CHLR|nr:TIGR00341 family protein [Phototrophicus methaneseepsis]QPC81260.1 TIGR00341 family protein [Phototrophicus methaneseepsis]
MMMALLNPIFQSNEPLSVIWTAQTTLIPVANPQIAPALIQLARRMMLNTGGHIIVLHIVPQDDEVTLAISPAYRAAVENVIDTDDRISAEFITHSAPTTEEGILEIATQFKVDLILLGLSYSVRGQVELGRVVETVAECAPCNVAVLRGHADADIDRVVVPVGGSIASKVILEMGIRLADGFNLPVEAQHIYSRGSERDARGHVADLLTRIPSGEKVPINVMRGIKVADSVLAATNENDMLIVGFSERTALEKWLYGNIPQRILDRARGPVLMVSRAIDDSVNPKRVQVKRRANWTRPALTDTEQEQIVWMAKDSVLPDLDYIVLLSVAAVIATLGLLMSSSAVIIGAMLVAPLMQPIISLAVGLCTARINLMRQALVTIVLSALGVLAIGFTSGVLLSATVVTKEMLGRAYPSPLDAGVALAAGFIGAYATARKDIPAALAGVAIAAALVPPICTAGVSLSLGEWRVAIGAALLFVTNLVSITLVGAVVFYWAGLRPTRLKNAERRRRYAIILSSILLVFFMIGGLLNITNQPGVEKISEEKLQTIFAPAEIIGLDIRQQDPLMVVATVRTADEISPETVKMAQVMLSDDLEKPALLRIIVQRVIDSSDWE